MGFRLVVVVVAVAMAWSVFNLWSGFSTVGCSGSGLNRKRKASNCLREREKSKGSKKFEREKTCLKKKIYLFLWQITNTTKAVFELTSNWFRKWFSRKWGCLVVTSNSVKLKSISSWSNSQNNGNDFPFLFSLQITSGLGK